MSVLQKINVSTRIVLKDVCTNLKSHLYLCYQAIYMALFNGTSTRAPVKCLYVIEIASKSRDRHTQPQ